MNNRRGLWFYVALISIIVIVLVYYQGLVADVNAVGPFVIQAGALAQGRNPQTFGFSNYPGTGTTSTTSV